MRISSPIIELRQYTLHAGQRDRLIELFEQEFIESQEALGIAVIGQFRDLDDPNRFVWLRGFPNMEARAEALAAFYGGPIWASHRAAANATMIDSDNVLLLRPASPGAGFTLDDDRDDRDSRAPDAESIVVAEIQYLNPSSTVAAFAAFFETAMKPTIVAAGARLLATLATETSPNSYPRLPVREGEHVFVWLSAFPHRAAYRRYRAALANTDDWRAVAPAELLQQFMRKPETLTLSPTRRSLLP